uniref:Uncharacterized protein n=1 Tax=Arundo donax TaxID=35708 RepID=A0A0A9GEM7_ARUDO
MKLSLALALSPEISTAALPILEMMKSVSISYNDSPVPNQCHVFDGNMAVSANTEILCNKNGLVFTKTENSISYC